MRKSPSLLGGAVLGALALAWPAPVRAAGPAPGAVSANTLQLPSGPGSVRGLPSDPAYDPFSAQVSYEIPFEAPTHGVGARVTLSYAGSTGNGPAGIGWRLSGAYIQRSTKKGVPAYDAADQLELHGLPSGGGRLYAIGGGEYRLEGRGEEVRVVERGQGFEVFEPDGARTTLGQTAASRLQSGLRVAAWYVDGATDLAGRSVRYEYTGAGGQVYLARATWGAEDQYQVVLAYESRADAVVDFRSGFRVATDQRIRAVEVRAFGEVLRRYDLAYDERFPVSRLATVVQRGRGGDGALPTLSFQYELGASPALRRVAGVGTWRLGVEGASLVDLDGDGGSDLLRLGGTAPDFRRSRRGTFTEPTATTGLSGVSLQTAQIVDLDGDARPEVATPTGDGWTAYRLVGTAWRALGPVPGLEGVPLRDPTRVQLTDINGDGFVDVVGWNNDGLLIRRGGALRFAPPVQVERIAGTALPDERGLFRDVNGDGISDYLLLADDGYAVHYGRGDGRFEPPAQVRYPWSDRVVVPRASIRFGDLNRDGVMDLVTAVLGNVTYYAGRPGGTFQAPVALAGPETQSEDVVVQLADGNGNGSEDVIWSSAGGLWTLDLAGPTNAGMLRGVDNGLGKVVAYTYDSSHALSIKDEAKNPWRELLPVSIPVVVRETTTLGPGEADRIVDYQVWDGFWDGAERQFGGFLTSIVKTWGPTAAETSQVRTQYQKGTGSRRALRGKPLNIQLRNGAGALVSIEEQTWEVRQVPAFPATPELKVPVMVRSTRTFYEGPAPRTTRVSHVYDSVGRRTQTTDEGRLDLTGDERVTTVTYADDATLWVRSKICEERVTDLSGTLVSHQRSYFGDDVAEEPLCQAGKGWPRRTEAYLAEEARFVPRSARRYDALGNVIEQTEAGTTRRIEYDRLGLFPVAERVSTGATELAWTMEWDRVLEQPLALTDPNGRTTRITYDSLGRQTSVALGEMPAHLVYVYDWTAPFPKNHVYTYDGAPGTLTSWQAQPGPGWRHEVQISNGRGQVRYTATELDAGRYVVRGYQERDANDRVVFVGDPFEAAALELAARPSGASGQTVVYDVLGRVVEHRLPNGSSRLYTHAAFEETVQSSGLYPVHNVLDARGRIVRTDRVGDDGTTETIDARYDALGRVLSLSLQGGAAVHSFRHDTLGRLREASDPDIGRRTLRYDDADRLLSRENASGQTVAYAYDAVGRLTSVQADDGSMYRYHYDEARDGGDNVRTRLGWVEEPTGHASFGYDAQGQLVRTVREIDGRRAEEHQTLSPSGLVLGVAYDDGFSTTVTYDRAARPTQLGDLWTLVAQDAGGRILEERFGNGVTQRYERDSLGLPSRVQVARGGGSLYDVAIARNAWAGVTALTDQDGVGLDHSATFAYDGRGRLTGATLGTGASRYQFTYAYDALQNMVSRGATGPRALGVLQGVHRYGEGGQGPRQLTSITGADGVVHPLRYDASGRQIAQDGLQMAYNGLDQLVRVQGLPSGGQVGHAYGHDGQRVRTTNPDGTRDYFFTDGVSERGGLREHHIRIADRVIARVSTRPVAPAAGLVWTRRIDGALGALPFFAGLFALAWAVSSRRRVLGLRLAAAPALFAVVQLGCGGPSAGLYQQNALSSVVERLFFHSGVAAGPVLFTGADGALVEERRYEPFGADVDAARGGVVGTADFARIDANALGKRTDPATGWSYHGARWMAPQTGRWLTPDPPVKAPDPKFMASPWALHPYAYVQQNPVLFWDADGRDAKKTHKIFDNALKKLDVVKDDFVGPLSNNQIHQTDFDNLSKAIDNISDNKGMITSGKAKDQTAWFKMLAAEIPNSPTFRSVLTTIGNDTTHPVTVKVGRKQKGVMVDQFSTNKVDLHALGLFQKSPRKASPNDPTRGELIIHFLQERWLSASGTTATFGDAHSKAFDTQNQRRDELGQSHVTGQWFDQDAAGNITGAHADYADGTKSVWHLDADIRVTKVDPAK